MVTIYDVSQEKLVQKLALEIKKMPEFTPPTWAQFVKTGVHKERPPVELDWWYMRAASVIKNIYKKGPIGVSKLRTLYGGKKNMGVAPEKFRKGSGSIIRHILQQMESAQLAKQTTIGVHKGRIVTPKGQQLVDKVVQMVANERT